MMKNDIERLLEGKEAVIFDVIRQLENGNARAVWKTLLREGEYSMGGIARRMGFSSAQHFSKQFRRYFGITPTEYVKSLR